MRSRALAADHEAAVARRLELLSAELASVRGDHHTHVRGEDGDPALGLPGSDSWTPSGYTRIRVVPDLDESEDDGLDTLDLPDEPGRPEAQPVPIPVPGRHSSRRRQPVTEAAWAELLPDTVRGRIGLGPSQLAVVAVLAVVGLVLTCWWLVRGDSHQLAVPEAVGSGAVSEAPSGSGLATPAGGVTRPGTSSGPSTGQSPGASASPSPSLVVDVSGRVRHPGIAVLRSGARVIDAIRAAGGARPGVDLGGLNLAQVLIDGQQIVVGNAPAAAVTVPSAVATASSGTPTGTLVNLNTADQTTLETLPEVGPVTAQAILTWRSEHGAFTAVAQLLDVDGIGDATLAQLTPFVTV